MSPHENKLMVFPHLKYGSDCLYGGRTSGLDGTCVVSMIRPRRI